MNNIKNEDYSILIVEDDAASLSYMSILFKRLNFKIFTSVSAERGFELFENNKIDLVISDISLPGITGIEMSRRIKNINPDTIIILVTALSDTKLLMQAIELNISNYVLKPIDKDVITQIVLKHIKILQLKRELSEEQHKALHLSLALQNSSSLVILLSTETKVNFINKGFQIFTGYENTEFNLEDILDFNTFESSVFLDSLELRNEWRGEICALKKDGSPYWGIATLTPLYDNEIFVGFILVFQDVTSNKNEYDVLKLNNIELEKIVFNRTKEIQNINTSLKEEIESRKLIEKQLLEAKLEAESSNEAKSMFLAKVSHELRTPLNGILGMSSLLSESELSERQMNMLGTINYSAELLLEIINELLDFSKIEHGKFVLNPHNFNFRETIYLTAEPLKRAANRKSLQLIVNIDENIPESMIGDSAKLRQIINNLISNSIKFTHLGNIELNFELLNQIEDKITIAGSVTDTGIGIPKDKFEEIFECFNQLEPTLTRKYGGTGLGLTITKEIVYMMNGKITVDSIPGTGSTFNFTIDFLPSKNKISTTNPIENPVKSIFLKKDIQILVIDDSEIIHEVLKSIFQGVSCKYYFANSATEAIEFANKKAFDIIFSDILLPDLNGFELIKIINESELNKNIPIVALTGNDSYHNVDDYRELGFSDLIEKPFSSNKIIEILEKYFQEIPIIELDILKRNLNNNMDTFHKILNYFVDNSIIEINHIEEGFQNYDTKIVSNIIHRMKSELGHLGATDSVKKAVYFEKEFKEKGFQMSALIMEDFINSVMQLREYIKQFLIKN
jgi:PAS domain S-box-containing protein